MKGMKKVLVAACMLALVGALFAGCSGQSSSSASSASGSSSAAASASASSSAASQDATEDLIKELEALPNVQEIKSVTMEMNGNITIDTAAISAALTESSSASASSASSEAASASSASSEASSASSASSESSGASDSGVINMPLKTIMKFDGSQEPKKLYNSTDVVDTPFELYLTGDNAVLVVQGVAYGGTLEEFRDMGIRSYDTPEEALAGNGIISFEHYKDSIKSITKETANGKNVYTVVIDAAKHQKDDILAILAELGVTDSASTITLTYTIGEDGFLSESTLEMSGNGFSLAQEVKLYDYNKTTVPDAPEATKTFNDLVDDIAAELTASIAS